MLAWRTKMILLYSYLDPVDCGVECYFKCFVLALFFFWTACEFTFLHPDGFLPQCIRLPTISWQIPGFTISSTETVKWGEIFLFSLGKCKLIRKSCFQKISRPSTTIYFLFWNADSHSLISYVSARRNFLLLMSSIHYKMCKVIHNLERSIAVLHYKKYQSVISKKSKCH